MPFAIWCTTCPAETIIGQGVRFNAEKKKVGNYYSTPIYSFRMKHTACGGWIEIRTDPKNTAYVVVEGAKKRDHGDDKVNEGDLELRTEEEKEKLRNDAFAALEVTIEDRKEATANKARIDELIEAKERDWDDPYAANQKLRKGFRVGRKEREKSHANTEALKDRMSLGIDLLEENAIDRRRAGLVEFGEEELASQERVVRDVQAKGLFQPGSHPSRTSNPRGIPKLKEELASQETRDRLRHVLGQNTRSVLDPFLSSKNSVVRGSFGLKRKRDPEKSSQPAGQSEKCPASTDGPSLSLVDYESE